MRILEFAVTKPHLAKKYKNTTIEDFRKFPWDNEEKQNEVKPDKKSVNATFEKWDNLEFKKTDKVPIQKR